LKAKQRESMSNLSLAELKSELHQTRGKRLKMVFKHRTAPLANPLELRELRRHIARLETYVRARELEQASKPAPAAAKSAR
jgi:large subunit ribosomal protein L29